MKKILYIILGLLIFLPSVAYGATTFPVNGGTGSTTLTGILVGNGTSPILSLTVGSGLTFSGSTLSATGGGSGTVNAGTTGQFPYYAANGSTLTATSSLFLAANGNVGIGTTTPVAKLDVAGLINTDKFSGYNQDGLLLGYASSTNRDTIFGQFAGGQNATTSATVAAISAFGFDSLNANTTGINNTGVGYKTLLLNTSGSQNTAVGANALSANATGTQNTAIGYLSLGGNTFGQQNVGVGYESLISNTIGNFNTAVGAAALFTNTIGHDNTAIGNDALASNVSGNFNVDVGELGLINNTSGTNNTNVGYQGMQSNLTGGNNVTVGFQALFSQTSGFQNVGIGFDSLAFANSTTNTAIGFQSGFNLTSGYDNVFIGSTLNTGGNNLTTGSGNIGIGENIVWPSTGTNNMLNIGNLLFGNLPATTTATTLSTQIVGQFGIGTSSPYATFSIQSNTSVGDAFVIATSSAKTIAGWDNSGHRFTSGPAPIVSTCGTGIGTVVGDDQGGVITTATAATACTLTFSKAYTNAPYCTVTDNSLVGFADISSVSVSTVTFGISSALTGGNLYYSCSYHK